MHTHTNRLMHLNIYFSPKLRVGEFIGYVAKIRGLTRNNLCDAIKMSHAIFMVQSREALTVHEV